MGTTVEVNFPLGRYHATPWDAGANSGYVEWPPSPWRVMRALVAVAHAGVADVDAAVALVGRLGNPSAFESAPITTGTTRHYMPDVKHRTDDRGGTDLVLDAFVSVAHRDSLPDLRIHWDAELATEEHKLLTVLVENLPYLGRSESVCEAKVSEHLAEPDASWWRVGTVGDDIETVELLAADGVPSREELEATPTMVRGKLRSVYPPGTRLLGYGRRRDVGRTSSATRARWSRRRGDVTAIRLELHGNVAIRMRDFLKPTDRLHAAIRSALDDVEDTAEVAAIIGKDGGGPRRNGHDHLHVIPIPRRVTAERFKGSDEIGSVVLWTPRGMSPEAVDRICRIGRLWTSDMVTENSFPTQRLLVAGLGAVTEIADEITAGGDGATMWRSATPYFPVRHQKRKTIEEFLQLDLDKELGYRDATAGVEVVQVDVEDDRATVSDLVRFRRRRLRERREQSRRGFSVRVTLSKPVAGPLLLGQLSHFGAGLFVPLRQ